MKTCNDCKHAEWRRTAAGSLHPDKSGFCDYPYTIPPLPACMHWMSGGPPKPFGGAISRGKELRDHCVYWARKD